jgi:hypothetical protein
VSEEVACQTNEWCARVWSAMAKECGNGCAETFRIEFLTGWPALGKCLSCQRKWAVHKNRMVRIKEAGEKTGAP